LQSFASTAPEQKIIPIKDEEPYRTEDFEVRLWMKVFFLSQPIIRLQLFHKLNNKVAALPTKKIEQGTPNTLACTYEQNRALNIVLELCTHSCRENLETNAFDLIKWAGERIRACSVNHDSCKNPFIAESSRQHLPLRLIDLGDYAHGKVKIVSTLDFHVDGTVEYFALSHC
jgi:hypothetical protein